MQFLYPNRRRVCPGCRASDQRTEGREGTPKRAWLITVARHLAVDAHRTRRARPSEAEPDDDLALAGAQRADASIDEAGVRAAIAALPGPQRQVLAEI